MVNFPTEPTQTEHRKGNASIADAQPVPKRIVVADDNHDAADSLAALFESKGHQVRKAYDGAHALALVDSFEPELVLLDIGMPRLNGYEVAERLRRGQRAGTMTLVAVTGWGADNDLERSRIAGFDHHLTKPVDARTLEAILSGRLVRP